MGNQMHGPHPEGMGYDDAAADPDKLAGIGARTIKESGSARGDEGTAAPGFRPETIP